MENKCDILANDSCEARQADDILIPKRSSSSSPSDDLHHFFIAFEIEFILPPAFPVEDEDDYLLVIPEMDKRTSFHRIWAPCKFLKSDNLPWKDVSNLLTKFGVPLHKQPFMVHRISACADEMASKDYNRRRKVLPVLVSIAVVVDYCVYHRQDAHSTCIRKAKQFYDLKPVPANEASVQALEKEKIQETSSVNRCMVCLEGLQIGSEARRMPCKHVFHQPCIFNWLRAVGFCPVCQVHLPA